VPRPHGRALPAAPSRPRLAFARNPRARRGTLDAARAARRLHGRAFPSLHLPAEPCLHTRNPGPRAAPGVPRQGVPWRLGGAASNFAEPFRDGIERGCDLGGAAGTESSLRLQATPAGISRVAAQRRGRTRPTAALLPTVQPRYRHGTAALRVAAPDLQPLGDKPPSPSAIVPPDRPGSGWADLRTSRPGRPGRTGRRVHPSLGREPWVRG
jgi:hypothetical protein